MAYGPNFDNFYNNFYNPIDFGGTAGVMAGIPNEARKDLFDFSSTPYTQMATQWTDLFGKRQTNEARQNQLDEQSALSQVFQADPTLTPYDDRVAQIYGKYGDMNGLESIQRRKQAIVDQELQNLSVSLKLGEVAPELAQKVYSMNGLEQKYGPLDTSHLAEKLVSLGDGTHAVINPQTGATRFTWQGQGGGGTRNHRQAYLYNSDGEQAIVEGDTPAEFANAVQAAKAMEYVYPDPVKARVAGANAALVRGKIPDVVTSEQPTLPLADPNPNLDPMFVDKILERLQGGQPLRERPSNKIVRVRSKVKKD